MDPVQPQLAQVPVLPVQPAPPTFMPQVSQEFCSKCKNPVAPTDNFCPRCGNQIVRKIGIGKQIWIYLVSIFLPPLGLGWTFKYIRSQNSQVRRVGIIAGLLTIISTVVTIWLSIGLLQGINQQVQTQLNGYQNLGL